MDDYEYDDRPCLACAHTPTHWRRCAAIGCDDGMIDMHEDDDPLWFDPGELQACMECSGTGYEWWCPACGWNYATTPPVRQKQAAATDEQT